MKYHKFHTDILVQSELYFPGILANQIDCLQDISIGGQCPCHGHASECPVQQAGPGPFHVFRPYFLLQNGLENVAIFLFFYQLRSKVKEKLRWHTKNFTPNTPY
jgi:hypothetical protein